VVTKKPWIPPAARGLGVKRRITNEAGGGRVGLESRERVSRELRIRLQPRSVAGAQTRPSSSWSMPRCWQIRRDEGPCLLVRTARVDAGGMQGAQQFPRARHQLHAIKHGLVPIGTVKDQRARELGLADKAAHGVLQAPSDGVPDLLPGGRRPPQLRQRVGVAAVDGRQVIQQRAIKIKQNSPETHEWNDKHEGARNGPQAARRMAGAIVRSSSDETPGFSCRGAA